MLVVFFAAINDILNYNKISSIIISFLTIPIASHIIRNNLLPVTIITTAFTLITLAILFLLFFDYNTENKFYILNHVYLYGGFLSGFVIYLCLYTNHYKLLVLPLLFSILFFGARGPQLSFLISILFYFVFIVNKEQFSKRKIYKIFIFLVMMIPLVIFLGDEFFIRSLSRWNVALSEGDESIYRRLDHIYTSFSAIMENPFFGVGFGGYGSIIDAGSVLSHPHNFFLELFVENGVIGGLPFLIFLTYVYIKSIKNRTWPFLLYVLLIMQSSFSYSTLNEFFFVLIYSLVYINQDKQSYEDNRSYSLSQVR